MYVYWSCKKPPGKNDQSPFLQKNEFWYFSSRQSQLEHSGENGIEMFQFLVCFFSNFEVKLVAYFSSLSLSTKMTKTLEMLLLFSVFDGFQWNSTLSYTNAIWKIFFENVPNLWGQVWWNWTNIKGKMIYVQILLIVFKRYLYLRSEVSLE